MSEAANKPRSRLFLAALVIALALAGAVVAYLVLKPRTFEGSVNALGLDLARPDALIRSHSLARLPADLLRVPLVRDVLTEDFVDYYEHHEQRLALSGTLRRIAFEHRLSLPERVLESVFDEPAEVALWRGADGTLKHFAVAMTRNALARTLQLALPVLPDAQLEQAGVLQGSQDPVLVLEYGYGRRLVLVARGDRVVALSDPGMLLRAPERAAGEKPEGPVQDAGAAALINALLDGKASGRSPFADHFALDAPDEGESHQLVLGSGFYTFGYDAFAPGVAALAFEFDAKGGWRSGALIDGARLPDGGLDGSALWAALPHGASLCAVLPVDWTRLAPLAARVVYAGTDDKRRRDTEAAFAGLFGGPAAVCWYGDSRLYTPIFVAGLKASPDAAASEQLRQLFAAGTGAGLPPKAAERADAQVWQRDIGSVFAPRPSSGGRLTPKLAVAGSRVLFSPDGELVDKALDVSAGLFPALADRLPEAGRTLAVLEPAALAALLRREVFAALPRREEAVLRNAADAHLLPRLEALARYPRLRVVRADDSLRGRDWHALEWQQAETAQ